MKARNLIGFAALAVVATLVTGVALNALVGTPTASARGGDRDRKGHGIEYDSDVDQTCKVHVEMSEVKRSDVCTPDANVRQSGAARGKRGHTVEYDSDVRQTCRVYIEMSKVDHSDVCTPDANVRQGSSAKKDHDKDQEGGAHDGAHDGYDKPRDDKRHDGDWRRTTSVRIDNQEKTTCEANGRLALNQCDVGGDANAFTSGRDGYDGQGGGYGGHDGNDDGWSKWTDSRHSRETRHDGWSEIKVENTEKTTCEANGLVALNQCDVDDDATAFGPGGLGRTLPLGGLLPVGGLLG